MLRSLKFIKGLIAEAGRADPRIRKQELFGGNSLKEKYFRDHQEELKKQFARRIFNQTESKSLSHLYQHINIELILSFVQGCKSSKSAPSSTD